MKLQDLRKPISEMSDEELLEEIRQIRHRRWVERPKTVQKEERKASKERRSKGSQVQRRIQSRIAGMSEAERAELIKLLGGNGGGSETSEVPET